MYCFDQTSQLQHVLSLFKFGETDEISTVKRTWRLFADTDFNVISQSQQISVQYEKMASTYAYEQK